MDVSPPARPAASRGSGHSRLSRPPFSTADLCDAYAGDVQVARPVFRDFGGIDTFAGPAETVRVFEDNALVRRMLDINGQGRVLVVDGGGSVRRALVGGQLANLAAERGWSGILVFGAVRDAAELAQVPVGIRALALCPMPAAKTGAGEQGATVSFAGVTCSPGDFVYADQDGLVLARRALL